MPRSARHRLVLAEHVLERRDVRRPRMASLLRLFELLRVAEQDEAPRGVRDGEHVGERHLAGLVDEQHIDGLGELGPRPEPGRAAEDVRPRRTDSASSASSLSSSSLTSPRRRRPRIVALVAERTIDAGSTSAALSTASSRLRITLWLVAVTPTFLPCATSAQIISRAGEGLAGAGRSLDREHGLVELADDADGELDGRLSRADGSNVARAQPRRLRQQQVAQRQPIRPASRARLTTLSPIAKIASSITSVSTYLCANTAVGMHVGLRRTLLDVDRRAARSTATTSPHFSVLSA